MAQAPAPPGVQDSVLFQKFTGLRNTVTAERLEQGELQRAVNIDLDDAGQPRRRRGYTRVSTGNYHSLYRGDFATFAVKNDVLGVVNPDYTHTALRSGIGSERLAYVQVAGNVYYSSSLASGVISENLTVSNWGAVSEAGTWLSPVVNPTETLPAVAGRLLGKPPMATALTYYNGRIYMAQGKTVWATDLYLYNYVDKTRSFLQFESDVTMLGAVTDGIYVGTTADVWFLDGSQLSELRRVPMMNYGALPGSALPVPAELVNPQIPNRPQSESKNAILFMSTSGLCVGLDNGMVYNLTQNKVLFPDAVSVAAMFRRQDGMNQYVGVADSGGSPSSAARIGDYVDAEIRRFQGA